MAKIVFASNNYSHFPGSEAGSIVGSFDPTRVPYAIQLSNYQIVGSPVFTPVVGTVTWFHFRLWATGLPFGTPASSTGIVFQCFDQTNRLIFDLKKRSSFWDMSTVATLYNGTTNVTGNPTLPLTEGKMNTVDVKITVTSVAIALELYFNSNLVQILSFGSNPNVITVPNKFVLGCGFGENLSDTMSYSEILVSDTDTRNARVNFLRPDAMGAFSDWDTDFSTVADDDATTGMMTVAAAQRQTMQLSPYTGAPNVSNFVSVSTTTRGINSPTKLRHVLRLSGVNYDSADIPLDFPLQYNLTDYELNPATSLPWTDSDLAAIESGFLSVA